jgi:hypothetical protein
LDTSNIAHPRTLRLHLRRRNIVANCKTWLWAPVATGICLRGMGACAFDDKFPWTLAHHVASGPLAPVQNLESRFVVESTTNYYARYAGSLRSPTIAQGAIFIGVTDRHHGRLISSPFEPASDAISPYWQVAVYRHLDHTCRAGSYTNTSRVPCVDSASCCLHDLDSWGHNHFGAMAWVCASH